MSKSVLGGVRTIGNVVLKFCEAEKTNNGSLPFDRSLDRAAAITEKHLILAEESTKKPCNRYFNSGDCPFGSMCRYSHYSKEQLDNLRWEVSQSQQAATSTTSHEGPTIQNWFASRRKRLMEDSPTLEKAFLETVFTKDSDVTNLMSWKYSEAFDRIPDLPPSLKRFKGTDFKDVDFAKWG